jgi:hypothetical protein
MKLVLREFPLAQGVQSWNVRPFYTLKAYHGPDLCIVAAKVAAKSHAKLREFAESCRRSQNKKKVSCELKFYNHLQ